MEDYRFSALVHGLRKYNRQHYALSIQASEELAMNDKMSASYTEEMWQDFWRELESEYRSGLENSCEQ